MKTGNTSLRVAGIVWKLKYQFKGSWNSLETGNTSLKVAGMETGNTSLGVTGNNQEH